MAPQTELVDFGFGKLGPHNIPTDINPPEPATPHPQERKPGRPPKPLGPALAEAIATAEMAAAASAASLSNISSLISYGTTDSALFIAAS